MQGLFFPLLTLLGGLSGLVGALRRAAAWSWPGTVTVGEFVAFGVYLAMLVWPMIALGWAVNLVQRGAASMGRINQLFRERPAITEPASAGHAAARRAAAAPWSSTGVWFRYPGAPSAAGCCRTSRSGSTPGRSLAIVGRHRRRASPPWWTCWSGPTTPTGARCCIDGVDLRRLPLAELRRAVGFVPQETFLFSETLRENVLLGAPDDGRLERVAEVSQLTEALPALPDGLRHHAGRAGHQPVGRPEAADRDRAGAGAGPAGVRARRCAERGGRADRGRILRALRGALEGRTSIIVSHRLAAVRDADWILVLDDGRIVEQGTHADLIARGGRYWELLRRQQLEEELEEEGVSGRLSAGARSGASCTVPAGDPGAELQRLRACPESHASGARLGPLGARDRRGDQPTPARPGVVRPLPRSDGFPNSTGPSWSAPDVPVLRTEEGAPAVEEAIAGATHRRVPHGRTSVFAGTCPGRPAITCAIRGRSAAPEHRGTDGSDAGQSDGALRSVARGRGRREHRLRGATPAQRRGPAAPGR